VLDPGVTFPRNSKIFIDKEQGESKKEINGTLGQQGPSKEELY